MRAYRQLFASLVMLTGLHAAPARAADCYFQPFSTVPGADVALHWTVKSGRACTLTLKVDGRIGVSDMHVVEQAMEGTASTPTLSSITYASRRGFVGHDRFTLDRTAEAMGRRVIRGTAHWTVDVDVAP